MNPFSDKEYLKRIDALEQKVKELTFENDRLKIELDKAQKAGPAKTGIESLASNASKYPRQYCVLTG